MYTKHYLVNTKEREHLLDLREDGMMLRLNRIEYKHLY